jgi:hypothetical protein
MAPGPGEMERPLPIRDFRIDLGALIEQVLDEVEPAGGGSRSERGETVTLSVDISTALFDEEAQSLDGCGLESGNELHESDVGLSAVLKDEFGDTGIKTARDVRASSRSHPQTGRHDGLPG